VGPADSQEDPGGPSRFEHGSFKGFRGHSHECRLLDSLGALWIARYPPGPNEYKRLLRALRCSAGRCLTSPGGAEAPQWALERVKGIEPSYSAWKAAALPLSYTRARGFNYHGNDAASTAVHAT
jgi:hypothetical protein